METKAWWRSKTIQGLIITAAGIAFPKYAPLISDATGATFEIASHVVEIAGIAWAAYGRIKTDGAKLALVSAPAEDGGN